MNLDMTIGQARAKHYSIFPNEDDTVRPRYEGAVKYIDLLASQTCTEVSDWPLSIFKSKGEKLLVERADLNEVFFEWKRKTEANGVPVTVAANVLDENMAREFNKVLANRWARKREGLLVQINSHKAQMQYHQRNFLAEQERMAAQYHELALLTKAQEVGTDFSPAINKILAAGFWSLAPQSEQVAGQIRFISRPVTMSHVKASQAINIVVPMGQYMCILTPGDGALDARVKAYKDNMDASGYIHPHIKRDGFVCLGSAKLAMAEATAKYDIVVVMGILMDILNTYNEGNPYTHLSTFDSIRKQKLAPQDAVPTGLDEDEMEFPEEEEPEEDYEPEEEPEPEDID